jgi:phosphatidylethanolamine/phosphatidyl-N-methylethanolamine N-methyltransferase
MDAESMSFADDSFDKVVAAYVVSVVPSPGRLVAEMRRVCKPGGDVYLVNHFRRSNPVVSMMERMMAPLSRLLGFHPDFSLEQLVEQTGFRAQETIPVNLFGYWTLLRSRNDKR